jgi:hypothetical protein
MTVGRQRMTQRALIERNVQPSEEVSPSGNDYGEGADDWTTLHAALPCWLYTRTEVGTLGSEKTVLVEEVRMLVPSGTDVTELDRVNGVTDRLGRDVRPGIYRIATVVNRRAFLELGLEQAQL